MRLHLTIPYLAVAVLPLLCCSGTDLRLLFQQQASPEGQYKDKRDAFFVDGSTLPVISEHLGPVTDTWAGLIPVDPSNKDRALFFWLFPQSSSRKQPLETDALIVWLADGPGWSASRDALQQIGPFLLPIGADETLRVKHNPSAWNAFADVLFVDQPVGSGLTTGQPNITSEADLAREFRGFFDGFLDVFPEYKSKKIVLAGQGFAASPITYIAQNFLADRPGLNYKGLVYVSPSLSDYPYTQEIPAYWFLKQYAEEFHIRKDYLEVLEREAAESGADLATIVNMTQFPPRGPIINDKYQFVYLQADVATALQEDNPCLETNDITFNCPYPHDPLGVRGFQKPSSRVNVFNLHPELKAALHVSPDTDYRSIRVGKSSYLFNTDFGDMSPAIATDNVSGKVWEKSERVLILTGKLDFEIISIGTLWGIQNCTWHGLQGFQQKPKAPFVVDGKQVGVQHEERGVKLVQFDRAGHEIATSHPGAVVSLVKEFLSQLR